MMFLLLNKIYTEIEKGKFHSGDSMRIFEKYVILDWFKFFGISVFSLC